MFSILTLPCPTGLGLQAPSAYFRNHADMSYECMSKEREELNRAFNRSRSRLAYLNIGLAIVLMHAAVIQICIMLLR
jgi:hypothetical protein